MTYRHGKDTVILIDGNDISEFTNNTNDEDSTDVHDTTCYGRDRKTHHAGLADGQFTISGVYDDGATGPRAVLKPLKAAGTAVPFISRPEGTGTGKAQSSVDVIVMSYNETLPVADMISWTAKLQKTGPLDDSDQI